MSIKTSLIGFYSYAYPKEKMKSRIDNTVRSLRSKNIDVNFIGYVADHDDNSIEAAKKKLTEAIGDSSSTILVISGWTESPPVLRIITDFLHLPILVWSLAGYYTAAGLISPAGAAGASLLNQTLSNLDIKHVTIYQKIGEELNIESAVDYLKFFNSLKRFKSMRIASIGYACSNLYPFMYDGNIIKKFTGIHVDNLDLLEIKLIADEVKDTDINNFIEKFKKRVCFVSEPSNKDLEILARYSITMDKIINENDYKGITLKCDSGAGKLLDFTPCMELSYISDKVEAICECDVYGLLTQVIIQELTGTKAMFLEFFEFYKGSVLMASCGFAPFSLCKGDYIKVQSHDWGGAGGLMNVSELKTGKVTLLNLNVKDSKMHMHLITGNAKTPENFQEEGWKDSKGPKIPALEIELDGNMEEFQENIAGPHYIIAYGDITKLMKMYCKFTGIRFNKHNRIE